MKKFLDDEMYKKYRQLRFERRKDDKLNFTAVKDNIVTNPGEIPATTI